MAKSNFIGVKLNNYSVKIIDAVEVMGHDDSLPYNAHFEVCDLNGNTLVKGKAWNDGWGGPSNYTVIESDEDARTKAFETLQKVNAECKECIQYDFSYSNEKHTINYGLDDVLDFLADLMVEGSKNNFNKTFAYKAVNDFLKAS